MIRSAWVRAQELSLCVSHRITPYHTVSHRIMCIMSYHIVSHRITSYHTVSDRITRIMITDRTCIGHRIGHRISDVSLTLGTSVSCPYRTLLGGVSCWGRIVSVSRRIVKVCVSALPSGAYRIVSDTFGRGVSLVLVSARICVVLARILCSYHGCRIRSDTV